MRDPPSEDIYKEEIKGISNTFQKHLKHLTKLKPRNLQRRILLPSAFYSLKKWQLYTLGLYNKAVHKADVQQNSD